MDDSTLNSSKEKTILNALNEVNPKFYEWLLRILKCNTTRTVSICTHLLNFNIQMNYFPWFKTLNKEIPDLLPSELQGKFAGFPFTSEIIFGIIILVVLKHKYHQKISIKETDKLIDKLWLSGPLVDQFFIFNSVSNRYHDIRVEDILDILPKFSIKDKMLPKLEFDPEFQKILNNDAVKQIYDTSFITDWLDSKLPKPYKYLPEKETFLRNLKIYRDKKTKIFDIDPSLSISKFDYRHVNVTPSSFFSSPTLIDELIRVFSEFYQNKLPNKKVEIMEVLSCFGELLKLMEGQFYHKFRYNALVKKLKLYHSKEKVKDFLEKFCLTKKNLLSLNIYEKFEPKRFIFDYHNFLSFAAYQISGFVYSGTFLVWRALIKYLESLQYEDEFKLSKGPLLEKWCFNKAIEFGFKPEKIVLRNTLKAPTEIYYEMKEQIKDFPEFPLEFEVEFPLDYEASFHEIDLAIRVEEYIFIFECKTTSMPIGEFGKYVEWIDNFSNNFHLLINKGMILLQNIEGGRLNHPYFNGSKHFVPYIIQTEGIISKLFGMDTTTYLHFLNEFKERVDNGTIKEFLKKNFGKPTKKIII